MKYYHRIIVQRKFNDQIILNKNVNPENKLNVLTDLMTFSQIENAS